MSRSTGAAGGTPGWRRATERLSEELLGAAGVRQTFAVLLPARLVADPGWARGPLPFATAGRVADAESRRRLFTPAAARALYERRWHRTASQTEGGLRLDGLELLRTPTARSPEQALAIAHFSVVGEPMLPLLRAISHRQDAPPDPLSGVFAPAALLAGVAEPAPAASPFALSRPYTVAFLTPGPGLTAALRDPETGELPDSADWLLRSLASRSTPADLPLPPEDFAARRIGANRISTDWSVLVLRQGAAFLGHRPDPGPGSGDFYDIAAVNARAAYLDALLLGNAQRDRIDELTDDLSEVFEGPGLARRVADLEQRIAVFRSTYWRQHLTAHGPANNILLDFQQRHRLPERFAQILAEAADHARLVQTQESQQIAGALGVLTVLGLPLGTALSVLQVLGDSDPWHLTAALAASFAATTAALTTRYGRLVVSSLRGGRRG
ncbi:hypothetical protein SAMN05216251_109100 [Actinacidiphila alni]|uniref:Uncharacterized protein n=1 Tax=Actinacidiphila alni TaxID=380248 RepID=A0A1I2GL55_9ACTN|nr:hypothetical protein [Actinacidiphila alni]SFF17321.1 hypothetical protein SAMN05216251_109100 [Actinacidiphila alni]